MDPTLCQYRICRINDEIVPQKVDWGFPAFENPRSSQLFHELVYDGYKKHLGEYFGDGLRGFFSDADNRRVNADVFYVANSPMRDYFPWSEDFRQSFQEKFGYDIWPYMNDVLDRKDTDQCVNYWQHCGDLYAQWFGSNYEWCKANGLEYTFHTSDTSPFSYKSMARSSAFTEGRFCDIQRNCDYCGTDHELLEINGGKHYTRGLLYEPRASWGSLESIRKSPDYYNIRNDVRTKQAQSTAFLYNKKGTMCEMFAATNYGTSYEELREISSFQIMQGVTFPVFEAYHYRSLGNSKWFAPPDFSPHGQLNHCNLFTAEVEKNISWCGKGTLKAPIAVLDITEDLWRHRGNYELFMDVCYALNQQPRGYIIADKAGIQQKNGEFSLIVNTGVQQYETIAGIPVANVHSIDELDAALVSIPTDISWNGTGTPHFMVRKTEDGLCGIIGNMENPEELEGSVTFGGKTYEVCLRTGELAYFSEKEQIYRKPVRVVQSIQLDRICPVSWESPNLLPITRWEDETGKALTQTDPDKKLIFRFRTASPVAHVKLYIPLEHMPYLSEIEGVADQKYAHGRFLDDPYAVFDVCPKPGDNEIIITKTAPLTQDSHIFLCGEFNVQVESKNPFHKHYFYFYNQHIYVPEKATVTLSARSQTLDTTCSAALQGHPFYRGSVTYYLQAQVPEHFTSCRWHIPDACNGIRIKINDAPSDMIFRPYVYPCTAPGPYRLELTTYSTNSNFLELYPREFGVLDGIYLEEKA